MILTKKRLKHKNTKNGTTQKEVPFFSIINKQKGYLKIEGKRAIIHPISKSYSKLGLEMRRDQRDKNNNEYIIEAKRATELITTPAIPKPPHPLTSDTIPRIKAVKARIRFRAGTQIKTIEAIEMPKEA